MYFSRVNNPCARSHKSLNKQPDFLIPSVKMLEIWIKRCDFNDIRCADVNTTSLEEQHATEWMPFESLPDFLDQDDRSKTIESYPPPIRATIIASI